MSTQEKSTSSRSQTSPLLQYSISEVLYGLRHKHFTVPELVKAYLQRMEDTQHLNLYITPTPEHALYQAEASQKRWDLGCPLPLDGIPLGVKDAFCTKGIRTTASSRILGNFVPPYESTVTQKLWDAGAILLGKCNLDEFCMGSTTTNTYIVDAAKNPWKETHVTGGSSGGSCGAVAAGSALAAVGSDTGGSIRQPAAFCGVVGVLPTYGRCSRWGVVAYASSLDQPSITGRTVLDTAIVLEKICGHDPKDATSVRREVPCFPEYVGKSVKGLRIGIPVEWKKYLKDPFIVEAWEKAKTCLLDAGCIIKDVALPYAEYALPCYYLLTCAEASSNLARYDGVTYGLRVDDDALEQMYDKTRGAGFGREVKRRLMIGTYVLSHGYYDAYYLKAKGLRRAIIQEFTNVFQEVDAILTPTTPTPSFAHDAAPTDPVTMYLNDILTVPVNVGGMTAISVPTGVSPHGLPCGMQLIAAPFQEGTLFQCGAVLEKGADMPPLPFALGGYTS